MPQSSINIAGFDLLGLNGEHGLRFAWTYANGNTLIESAAFPQRSTMCNDNICGYTTSVSAGCMLKSFQAPCSFCRTGKLLPFSGPLSYFDIAKQNVFMVLADINCSSHPELHNRPREFAYMGQGEPGLSYTQLRIAIELTNRVMKKLNQKVHRHIFATCGIPEAINAYKQDLRCYFTERVTLHFSLHATQHRALLMPIDRRYPHSEILHLMNDIHEISGEKPCIGIMLLKNFCSKGSNHAYSNDFERVKQLLSELDSSKFRLSFCEFNTSNDICTSDMYCREDANRILLYAKSKGFDAKLFSSFGKDESTACGMLGAKTPDNSASEKWKLLDKEAEELIKQCI